MPERELAGALACHLLEADELDQLADAGPRDAVGLSERQQVVVGRPAGVHRPGFEQRSDLVQWSGVVTIGFPLTVASPEVGASRPRIRRIVVDFPDPFGPRNPVTTPGSDGEVEPVDGPLVTVVLRQRARDDHDVNRPSFRRTRSTASESEWSRPLSHHANLAN